MAMHADIEQEQYVHVGPILGIGETTLTIEEAQSFRNFVAQQYMPTVPMRIVGLSESHDKSISGARHLITLPNGVEAERYVTVMLQHGPGYWRLGAMVSRAYRSMWNDEPAKVTVRYALEAWGPVLVEARRETRLVRTIGALTAEEIAQGGQGFTVQRRKMERAMIAQDVTDLTDLLVRVSRWRKAAD